MQKMADQPTIFLCHATEDKEKVFEIYDKLKAAGLKPWLDKIDLLPGQYWDREIRKALKSARFIMIFFSAHSIAKRGYVQREFKLALKVLEEIPEDQIFIIPVRLDNCRVPERFQHIHYCDLFEKDGFERVLLTLRSQIPDLSTSPPIEKFRSTPLTDLSEDAVIQMLKDKGFFDSDWNESAKGFVNDYHLQKDGLVVVDRNSGLMWQQSGSANFMNFKNAKKYIEKLNREKFAGYSDWRLPTLEEAMSLMEPEKKNSKLYIDPVFDNSQLWIWTADRNSASLAWIVGFYSGLCTHSLVGNDGVFARAVRS